MAPKSRLYKTPDGKEFINKSEYRDYMMATFYSWKNKNSCDGELVKRPGDIDGQVFDIADSEGCTMVIMDLTEQVQVDGLTDCRVFIGCCASSTFIRNCKNCTFYVSCRQLRLREVIECNLYVYSQSEVHIEESHGLKFAPFNGGYPEQAAQLVQAKVNLDENLWYDIFDHNDPDKNKANWSLLPASEWEEPWWPMGECEPAITKNAVGSVVNTNSQVGDAFNMEKLRQDDAAIKMEHMTKAIESMSMEVALLIMTAIGKGIDVSMWLTESAPVVPVVEFNDKLIDLGLTISIGEEMDTKAELDSATSPASLAALAELFATGPKRENMDVTMFLNCAQQKVQSYLGNGDEGGDSGDAFESSQSKDNSQANTTRAVTGGASLGETFGSVTSVSALESLEGSPEVDYGGDADDEYTTDRGHKFKGNKSRSPLHMRVDPNAPIVDANTMHGLLPDSPYDEEVAFDLQDDEDDDTANAFSSVKAVRGSTRTRPATAPERGASASAVTSARHPIPGKHMPTRAATATRKAATAAATASGPSEGRGKKMSSMSIKMSRPALRSSSVPRTDPPSSGERAVEGNKIKGGSFGRASRSLGQLPKKEEVRSASPKKPRMQASIRSSSPPRQRSKEIAVYRSVQSLQQMSLKGNLPDFVMGKVRHVVQSTDLYHLLQVHLGFIEKYTLVPPRGAIVDSSPRAWLTVNEIITAFESARVHFKVAHVYTLMKLVEAFKESSEAADNGSYEQKIDEADVIQDRNLSSFWLKAYLVNIRLAKKSPKNSGESAESKAEPPQSFEKWLVQKRLTAVKKFDKKPREFKRALAGRPYDLTKAETEHMLEKHQIVPADMMKRIITQRLQAWVFDIDGRKDYQHAMNMSKQKWCKEKNIVWIKVGEEKRKELVVMMKAKVLQAKAAALKEEEKSKAVITKDIFFKYRHYLKQAQSEVTIGSWLQKYLEEEKNQIKRVKEFEVQRAKLCATRAVRKNSVAPLVFIEKKFNEAAKSMPTKHAIELKKAVVVLRKRAIAEGLGKKDRILVSKALFDTVMADVVASRMMELTPDLRGLAEEARKSHETVGQGKTIEPKFSDLIGGIFISDQDAAISKAKQIKESEAKIIQEDFQAWEQKKAEVMQSREEAKRASKAEKAKAEKKRKLIAEKAYKQWLRLRKSGKYLSKVDNKARHVPVSSVVEHDDKWSKDVELAPPMDTFL